MAFNVEFNTDEKEQFLKVMALYPDYMYVNGLTLEEGKTKVFILGEGLEKDCLLQESLMEHMESVNIEEIVGEN
jgi:hypothetical protein